jgi:hypothetical protein
MKEDEIGGVHIGEIRNAYKPLVRNDKGKGLF